MVQETKGGSKIWAATVILGCTTLFSLQTENNGVAARRHTTPVYLDEAMSPFELGEKRGSSIWKTTAKQGGRKETVQ